MAIIAGTIIILLLLLTSCSTKKTITEYVAVHDTMVVHHTDTIRDTRLYTIHDTLTQREVHTITLNNVGDTVREVHHYHDTQRTIVVDSTDRYKAVVDSLRQALDKSREQEKEVVKTRPAWWEYGAYFCVVAIVLWLIWRTK